MHKNWKGSSEEGNIKMLEKTGRLWGQALEETGRDGDRVETWVAERMMDSWGWEELQLPPPSLTPFQNHLTPPGMCSVMHSHDFGKY